MDIAISNLAVGSGCVVVIHRPDGDPFQVGEYEVESFAVSWRSDSGFMVRGAGSFYLCCALPGTDDGWLLSSELGEVTVLTGADQAEEDVSEPVDGYDGDPEDRLPEHGPERHGELTGMRVVGGQVWTVGMGRQAYRRVDGGGWVQADRGMLEVDADSVSGLYSIDGAAGGRLYAVGMDGEVWAGRDGTWQALASPTDLSLTCVRSHPDGTVYAVGQGGVVLKIVGDAVETVPVGLAGTTEQVEFFAGAAYVATAYQGIVKFPRWPEPATEKVATDLGTDPDTRMVLSGDALWLYGPSEVAFTHDGETWHPVPVLDWFRSTYINKKPKRTTRVSYFRSG